MGKKRIIIIVMIAAIAALVVWRIVVFKRKNAANQTIEKHVFLVETDTLVRANFEEMVDFTGTIEADRAVDLYPKIAGKIESVHHDVGDKVKAGDLLLVIEHADFVWQEEAAKAAVEIAQVNLKSAGIENARFERLFAKNVISQAELEATQLKLEMAKAQEAQAKANAGAAAQRVKDAFIKAPFSGVVVKRPVQVASQVSPQMFVISVENTNTLKLTGTVDASTLLRLKVGAVVDISVDALLDKHFKGKIVRMAPSLDQTSRRAELEVRLNNQQATLLAHMFAHASVLVEELKNVVIIPRAGIVEDAGGKRVFRIKNKRVEVVKPDFGPLGRESAVVLKGLEAGDVVVVKGQQGLFDGAEIRLSNEQKGD